MRKTVAIISVALGLTGAVAPASVMAGDIIFTQNHYVTAGNEALVKGDFVKASKYLRLAVKSNLRKATMVNTLNNLCAADYMQDKLEAAKESCDKAIKMDHSAWRPYVIRGHINAEQGNIELAKLDYNMTQSLNPGEEISNRFLAKLEKESGLMLAKNEQ